METKVICQNCGAEVIIPEHESVCTGRTVAKDSNLGTVVLQTKENKKMNKAEQRIETLKAQGVDTSKYFSITNESGAGVLMKWENGVSVVVPEDVDEIESEIYANGYVKNTKLHRRFVMAQMFHALAYENRWRQTYGFNAWLQSHGFDYQFKMMLEELIVMSKIEGADDEAFNERKRFFSPIAVAVIIDDYANKVREYIDGLTTKSCKGIPYKTIKGNNVFVDDIEKKVICPIRDVAKKLSNSTSFDRAYRIFNDFYRSRNYIRLPRMTEMSTEFVDIYKKEGAYYTLLNMIRFHSCEVVVYETGEVLRGYYAEEYVKECVTKKCGYEMLGLLKGTIKHNKFDFNQRMKEIYG